MVAVGCNVQTAVDAKNKMIVDQEVTNQVVDMGLLQATAEPARAILEVERIDVVADKGYFRTEDIDACEKAGLTPYVPRPQRGSSAGNSTASRPVVKITCCIIKKYMHEFNSTDCRERSSVDAGLDPSYSPKGASCEGVFRLPHRSCCIP